MKRSLQILSFLIVIIPLTSCDLATEAVEEATKGSVEITVKTGGEDIDEDGYTLIVGDEEYSLDPNDSVTISGFQPDTYEAELQGIASNCDPTNTDGSSEFGFVIVPSETTPITVTIECDNQAKDKVVISKEASSVESNQIYIMDSDGSNVQQLTNTDSNTRDLWPVFSNDGTQIAFVREIDNGSNDFSRNLYVMDVNGENIRKVTEAGFAYYAPSWSSDDETLTYSEYTSSSYPASLSDLEIFKINVDGTEKTRLTENDVLDRSPSWSPDGEKILYHSLREGGNDLNLMNPDGTEKERLTNTSLTYVRPRWSNDGERIAFLGYGSDSGRYIYTIDADGSNQDIVSTEIDQESFFISGPTWSPDDSELMYSSKSNQNTPENILKTSSNSVQVRMVTDADAAEEQMPHWSPIASE